MTVRKDQKKVRIQFVFTSLCTASIDNSEERTPCIGTCRKKVDAQIAKTMPNNIQPKLALINSFSPRSKKDVRISIHITGKTI